MPGASLHVVQVGFYVDPMARAPAALLEAWATLVDVAEAAQQAGLRVTVVQACRRTEILTRNGVRYRFAPLDDCFFAWIGRLAPDVLHVHGLVFPGCVLRLSARCPGVPILLQDHASRAPRPWRRGLHRRALAAAAGVAFCAREQSRAFTSPGLIRAPTQVYEIPESTSRFTPGPRAEARARTGLAGEPCLLWVGHLDANKDPLAVLAGVSRAAQSLPDLTLWCCFGRAPLGAAVARRIGSDPRLRGRVRLLGWRPHREIERMMRAADIFVSASHREGSGYALIEALACGLPPLVTDIPSFRMLTGNGAVGRLWRCGDAADLAQGLLALAANPAAAQRAAVRAYFERELSFRAVGRRLRACYESLLGRDGETADGRAAGWRP